MTKGEKITELDGVVMTLMTFIGLIFYIRVILNPVLLVQSDITSFSKEFYINILLFTIKVNYNLVESQKIYCSSTLS